MGSHCLYFGQQDICAWWLWWWSNKTTRYIYLWKIYIYINLIFTDQWKNVTNMPIMRRLPGLAALDNKIYVTGGLYGDKSSVDCYDPDTNTWSQVANMNMARQQHSLVSHGRLYAIGGDGVDSVEAYDPDNDTWTLLQHKLNGKVRLTGAGLIKKYYLIK